MDIDEVTEILLNGTSEQIRSLENSDVEFSYDKDSGSMRIRLGQLERRMHKVYYKPRCVEVLGERYTFACSEGLNDTDPFACFLMDDTYEMQHKDDPTPVVSDELSAQMLKSAEQILGISLDEGMERDMS